MIKEFVNEILNEKDNEFNNMDEALYFVSDYIKSLKIANSKRIFDELNVLY